MIFCNASKFSAATYRVDLLPAHDGGEGTSEGDAKPRQNRVTAIESIEYASKYSRAIERQKKKHTPTRNFSRREDFSYTHTIALNRRFSKSRFSVFLNRRSFGQYVADRKYFARFGISYAKRCIFGRQSVQTKIA